MRRTFNTLAILFGLIIAFTSAVYAAESEGIVPDNNVGRWAILVGAFLPLVIATVNRKHWSSQAKGICTFVVSAIAAAGTSFFAGQLSGGDLLSSLLIILVSATLLYQTFWKPSGIAGSVEQVTG